MDFFPEHLSTYINQHTSIEDEVLTELNKETHQKFLMPQMLSGQQQGVLLNLLISMIQPENVLEIGTYTGYSAICMAKGLPQNGHLHTIDINDELEWIVKKYIDKAKLTDSITMHIGDATKIISTLPNTWDVVFIDADKINYSTYYDLVFPRLRVGGYIIADNVLWSGKIADKSAIGKDTAALRSFNDMVQADSRVTNLLLSVRDGLMVIRKNND